MAMDVHYSSKSNEWNTPQDLFNTLDDIFGFSLDPCSTRESAKCLKYFTEKDNGLTKSWEGETVFMNPPYGREIGKWMKKAYDESRKEGTVVVCLIPSRTDTKYWHDYAMKAESIYFVKGRLKFGRSPQESHTSKGAPAPFPSAIVVFGEAPIMPMNATRVYTISNRGV